MRSKVLVPWALCRREPSVNAGSGITSDTVQHNKKGSLKFIK